MESRVFGEYEVFENGTIINKHGNKMQAINKGKSLAIRLTIDGKRRNFIVSRLVYWLFNPEFDISNKDLCVVAEDMINFTHRDLKVVHRKDLIQGQNHKSIVKLTDEDIQTIKNLYNGKACVNQYDKQNQVFSYQDIANRFGVTKGLIAQIIRGETRNEENYKLK